MRSNFMTIQRVHRTSLFVLVALFLSSCGDRSPDTKTLTSINESLSAEQILRQMVDAYRTADGYEDDGILRLSFPGRVSDKIEKLAVTFRRPAEIR